MNGPNAIFYLGGIELFIAILYFLKIVISIPFFTLKYKAKPNSCFWIYLFFSITFLTYILLHNAALLQGRGAPDFIEFLNPITLDYFRNIFYTGSSLYILIFCYKLITNIPTEDIYKGAAREKRIKLKHSEQAVYIFGVLSIFIQVIMIGLTPHFYNSSLVKPELISTFVMIFVAIPLIYFYFKIQIFKSILFNWIWYFILSFFILPISFFIEFVGYYIDFYENGLVILICLRAPFLVLRLGQFFFLSLNLIQMKDVRLCYD